MKVMLVDDEDYVRRALSRVLRGCAKDLDIRAFADGPSALRALEAEPFDLLLTDMRMPGMDGARLLELASACRPDLVRIVLSGQMDASAAARASLHAHHFLEKPCASDELRDTVRRAGRVRGLLADAAVKRVAGGSARLAPAGRAGASTGARAAAACDALFAAAASCPELARSARLSELRTHLEAGAALAGGILDERADTWAAALLADLGLLAAAMSAPAEVDVVSARVGSGEERLRVEREVLGATHPEIGAYLLGVWGFPLPVVEAVRAHHDPLAARGGDIRLTAACYVGSTIADGAAVDAHALAVLLGDTAANDMLSRVSTGGST